MPRSYYSVTEICSRLGVRPHVLRYWEREFDLKVKRNSAGRRIYSDAQLERLEVIRHLVCRDKLTVRAARRQLARMRSAPPPPAGTNDLRPALLWLKKELVSIRALIRTGAG